MICFDSASSRCASAGGICGRISWDWVCDPKVTPPAARATISVHDIVASMQRGAFLPGLSSTICSIWPISLSCSALGSFFRVSRTESSSATPSVGREAASARCNRASSSAIFRLALLEGPAARHAATARSGRKGNSFPRRSGQIKIASGMSYLRAMGKAVRALSSQPSSNVKARRGFRLEHCQPSAPVKSTSS